MSSDTVNDSQGDADLKGKEFDEVCELIRNQDVGGSVHKRPDGGGAGRWAFCFSFGPSEYNESQLLDLISAEYGPGTYPVQFKSTKKGERPVIRWHKDMIVQARRHSAQVSTQAPSHAPSTGTTGLEALALALDNQARILEKMSDIISKPPPAMKTTIDFVQELGAIKDLFTDNRQGALEQFKDAMELRKLIKDDDDNGGGDPLSMALKTLTPAIERGITALQESDATPARPTPPPADKPLEVSIRELSDDEIQANIAGVEASTDAAVVYAFQFFAEKYLPAALQLAESGQDPEQVAEYLVRLIGNDARTIELVGIVVAQDDMVLRFAKVNARVLQFTAWLDSVADWLAHALWPDTNPAPDGSSATPTATNDQTAGHGGINDADTAGAESADTTATEGQPPNAKQTHDLPGNGDGNDT